MAQEFKEKTLNINLRRVFDKPTSKRAIASLYVVKESVKKETRKTNIALSNGVNELLWSKGKFGAIRNITVKVVADEKDKSKAMVYLPDEKIAEKKEAKKAAPAKKEEAKKEEVKEDKAKEPKKKEEAKATAKAKK